jgi:protein tyrosine phosphatase (PTP) superfamily phosphohydrolase (DUF442 family)/8-oxo-dGTP pyrophosphatase MutT (NUDIX family)
MNPAQRYCPMCASPLSTAEVDSGPPRLRCAAPGCGYVHWDNPVPVVAAIVEHEGDIILGRNREWPAGMFALITGFLEKHDPHPESGVLREVEEELGLQGRVAEFVGHYTFTRRNQLIIAFHVIAEGTINLGEELVEFQRVPPAKLVPWPGGTGDAVRDWMTRRGLAPPSPDAIVRSIYNFREIGPELATAGQPTAAQLRAVRSAGFEAVINLLPPDTKHSLAQERELVAMAGLRYHPIPVVWEAPTAADFDAFCAAMEAERGHRVLVHCAANMRVSAFVFLYRVLKLGVPRDEAEAALRTVWEPTGTWRRFIDERLEQILVS